MTNDVGNVLPAVDISSTARLCEAMAAEGIVSNQDQILKHLYRNGLEDTDTLLLLAQDFVDRPEVFSSLLISDFGFPPLVAHQTRAVVMGMIQRSNQVRQEVEVEHHRMVWEASVGSFSGVMSPSSESLSNSFVTDTGVDAMETEKEAVEFTADYGVMRKNAVNAKAAQRRKSSGNYEYGLPLDYEAHYPTLASELQAFYKFMTEPSTQSQEDPIRPATADVYHRHAKLYLGWFINIHKETLQPFTSVSIYSLIPSKEKESAQSLIDFVLWLRRDRNISSTYEANLLRGLIKFLKFRFSRESETDPSYGGTTFTDIPIIKELRKLHRTANQKSRFAPKSSDEQKKWLSWPEFLDVIQKVKEEVLAKTVEFRNMKQSELRFRENETEFSSQQGEIASLFQIYLILAIFASIPDRQRTIRELEIGRTLIKDDGSWFVKHGPDDYKTGKSYGERPPLQLAPELTPAIDEFIDNWRPSLRPSTNFLFVQKRTGKPMTGDSVFQRVSRSCFKYTGKRTNPHLLRSMIITHVREESNASEKELEALALFMGHSIQMQRSSYDKRTLTKKIAPAVHLMQSVNQNISQQRHGQ